MRQYSLRLSTGQTAFYISEESTSQLIARLSRGHWLSDKDGNILNPAHVVFIDPPDDDA